VSKSTVERVKMSARPENRLVCCGRRHLIFIVHLFTCVALRMLPNYSKIEGLVSCSWFLHVGERVFYFWRLNLQENERTVLEWMYSVNPLFGVLDILLSPTASFYFLINILRWRVFMHCSYVDRVLNKYTYVIVLDHVCDVCRGVS